MASDPSSSNVQRTLSFLGSVVNSRQIWRFSWALFFMKFDALHIERSFFLEKFQNFHVMYCNDWRTDFFLFDQNIFTVIYVPECLGAEVLSFSVMLSQVCM